MKLGSKQNDIINKTNNGKITKRESYMLIQRLRNVYITIKRSHLEVDLSPSSAYSVLRHQSAHPCPGPVDLERYN